MNGNIFDIQRFCVHDGPGIRTTVFFKGCPLRCVWCHNPESQKSAVNIAYYGNKCILCGECADVCQNGCHAFTVLEATSVPAHVFDRKNCASCGACAEKCSVKAIEKLGKSVSADEVISEVIRDALFYKNSGGGLTVSGGEPLMQADFLAEILTRAKKKGIHTCIETCGFASTETVKKIAPLTDLFLFDIKETDSEKHKLFTGVPLEPIIENLRLIESLGVSTVLRCPIIPEKNLRDGHLRGIAELCASLKNVTEINVMAYHTLGSAKYDALSMPDEMKDIPPMSDEIKKDCIKKIAEHLSTLGVENIKVC